ncbi:MAG TPA: hypothetical protein VEP89_13975 [Draconibacterium sp.]|nr:hypothetical protein [Draconibacterium sp.]|tara:strand:+ start:7520 stop:7786 length:267 start_codon:yes stop_codon:yes gene_type:complete
MLSDYLILQKEVINSAAKGNTYAKTAVKEHLRKWMEAHDKDHARIEAQHIIIHSISFLKREEIVRYEKELLDFIEDYIITGTTQNGET